MAAEQDFKAAELLNSIAETSNKTADVDFKAAALSSRKAE